MNEKDCPLCRAIEDVKGFASRAKPGPAPAESGHTPGPWTEGPDMFIWGNGVPVADPRCMQPNGATMGEMEANARLIAAAPDLLAACEAAVGVIDAACTCNHIGRCAVCTLAGQLELAIAHARGREIGR